MSNRWQLTVDQHNELKRILARSKPALYPGDIEDFLKKTGHIVNGWLNAWPPGWKDRDVTDRAAVREFSNHAMALLGAYRKMSDNNRFMIAMSFGKFRDSCGGFDYRDVYVVEQEIDDLIVDLSIADSQRHDPNEGPIKRLPERDLCRQIALLYLDKFGRAPSANVNGSFAKFINHLTGNIFPVDRQVAIGSDLLRRAANQARITEQLLNEQSVLFTQ